MLPASNIRVLELLSVYRFLTVAQLHRLGVAGSEGSIYNILRRFERSRKAFIEKVHVGQGQFIPGVGRLPMVLCLSRHGAEWLANHHGWYLDQMSFPLEPKNFGQDYFHRIGTVDIHIALREWAAKVGARVQFVEAYFEKIPVPGRKRGSNWAQGKTRVDLSHLDLERRHFEPDLIAHLTKPGGKEQLLAIELHNGQDVERFYNQMMIHAYSIMHGLIEEKYELNLPCETAWVFEHSSTMQSALKRLRSEAMFANLRGYVHFHTLVGVKRDYGRGWKAL